MKYLKKIIRNSRYAVGFYRRVLVIGLLSTIKEWINYFNKYSNLPQRINQRSTLEYKIFVWHNYLRIVYYSPEIDKKKLVNIVPKYFAKNILCLKTNPLSEKIQLVDKVLFYRILKKNRIHFPETYFYFKDGYYYDLDGERADNIQKYYGKRMFIKSLDGSSGSGTDIIDFNESYFLNNKTDLVFQEFIQTEASIREIAPVTATPTLRINSYLDKNNGLEICSAFIKLPMVGTVSDNMNTGSIGIAIDFETGKLSDVGITVRGSKDHNGDKIYIHPTSKIKFGGFSLPYWNETLKLIEEMHHIFSMLRFIGWDIAITDNGPVVIEGNSVGDVLFEQLISDSYFNKRYIQENIN